MKRLLISGTMVIFFSMILLQTADSKVEWKLTKSKNGVKNYIAPLNGSKYNQYMAVGVITAKWEVLTEMVRDISIAKDYFYLCKDVKVIKNKGNDNYIVYYAHDAQWPVKDRDGVVNVTTIYNIPTGRIDVFFKKINYPGYALNKKYFPMADLDAKMTFTPVDRNHIKLVFLVKMEPGGGLSPGLMDSFTKNLPLNTILNMREVVKRQKYIDRGKKCDKLPQILSYHKKIGK